MYKVFFLALLFALLFSPQGVITNDSFYALGAPYERFNNENWFTLPHPAISYFHINEDGSAYGTTEDNRTFTQSNVPNLYGLRIQRFEIEDHYHYIVEGEIAYTSSELSILLAQYVTEVTGTITTS